MEVFGFPFETLLTAALLLSATAWVVAFRRAAAGQPLLRFDARRHVPWGLVDLMIAFVMIIGCSAVLSGVLVVVLWQVHSVRAMAELPAAKQAAIILVGSLASLLGTIVALVLIRIKNGASWRDFGIETAPSLEDLRIAGVAFLMLAAPVFLIQAMLVRWQPSKHPLVELIKEKPGWPFFLVAAFSALLVAPVAEEFFFRVLLQGWLEKLALFSGGAAELLAGRIRLGTPGPPAEAPEPSQGPGTTGASAGADVVRDEPPSAPPAKRIEQQPASAPEAAGPTQWPIFVSAAVFALMHYSHGPDPIPLFVFAVGLGYIYQRTHRVLPCVVVHLLLNTFSLTMLLIDLYLGPA